MIEMLRRGYQALRRPSLPRTVTIWSLCAALVAAMLAAGAGTVSAQSTTSTADKPVSTQFGQTVVLTTDQQGAQTPFNLVLLNGQTSGDGTQKMSLDMDNYGTKTWDLNNQTGQVQNFLNVSGPFQGQVPITISTSLKVNGQEVDANKGYNLNGEVEITYTMENHTGRQQEISYKGIDGQTYTTKTDIPVPFGNAFTALFGKGWYITDAGEMTQNSVAGGTQLAATGILFPIISGVVGGTTQSYTIKAHAENASLPGTKSTAVPQNLDAMLAQYTPQIVPVLQNDVINPIESMFADSIGEVLGAANLVSGYTGSFTSLNQSYIDPLINEITSIKVNPVILEQRLGRLEVGLRELGKLLLENEASADQVTGVLVGVSNLLGTNLANVVKWFDTILVNMAPAATDAAHALRQLEVVMNSINTQNLENYANPAGPYAQWCQVVGATSVFYGNTTNAGLSQSAGYAGLSSAISGSSGQQKAALQALQGLLGKGTGWSGGGLATTGQAPTTLPPGGAFMAATVFPGKATVKGAIYTYLTTVEKLPAAAAAQMSEMLVTMLGTSGCVNTLGLLNAGGGMVTKILNVWDQYKDDVPTAILALNLLASVPSNPKFQSFINGLLKDLHRASQIVNQPSCTNADVLRDLEAAIKKYGISGISGNLEAIMLGILQNCGLAQLVSFLGSVDGLVGKASQDLSVLVGDLKKDTPTIAKATTGLTDIAAEAGNIFDAIPGAGKKVGDVIAGFAGKADVAGKTLEEKIANYVSLLMATVHAMSQRTTNGDGAPYGNVQGTNVTTAATYQITQQPAKAYGNSYVWAGVLAAIFLLIALGLGTFLYRRRRNSLEKFIDGGTS